MVVRDPLQHRRSGLCSQRSAAFFIGGFALLTFVSAYFEARPAAGQAALIGLHLIHISIAWTLFGSPGLLRSLIVRNTALFRHDAVGMGVIAKAVVYLWPLVV